MDEFKLKQTENLSVPDDFVEDALHRYAVQVNRDKEIPAIFPDSSLQYLRDLGYSLPRRGYFFGLIAREFVPRMAIDSLPTKIAAMVAEFRVVRQRKEDAIARCDFDIARELRDRQYELQDQISEAPISKITRVDINTALSRIGVDLDELD